MTDSGAGLLVALCGLAVGSDGLVVLRRTCVEGLSAEGRTLWTLPVPAPPVRWGVALTGQHCVVTLTNGLVLLNVSSFIQQIVIGVILVSAVAFDQYAASQRR